LETGGIKGVMISRIFGMAARKTNLRDAVEVRSDGARSLDSVRY